MARKFGSVNVEMWNDPEFRALPPAAQHLYLLLWTAPNLSFCGVHDWRPARLTHLSTGFTEEHTRLVADSLAARYFLVIDEETEEVLVRSWARFDELLKQPRLAVSYSIAYKAVYSENLRLVLAHETKKMRDLWPELACWKDERVAQILDHPAVSAKDLAVPSDPFTQGFDPSLALGLAQTQPKVWPRVSAPPTPSTLHQHHAPSPIGADKSAKTKQSTSLPAVWAPNDKHQLYAEQNQINITFEAEQFRDHHLARGSKMKDWDAAFRTWLRNHVKFRGERPTPARSTNALRPVETIPEPPDGLTDAEYGEWYRKNVTTR